MSPEWPCRGRASVLGEGALTDVQSLTCPPPLEFFCPGVVLLCPKPTVNLVAPRSPDTKDWLKKLSQKSLGSSQ